MTNKQTFEFIPTNTIVDPIQTPQEAEAEKSYFWHWVWICIFFVVIPPLGIIGIILFGIFLNGLPDAGTE